MNRTNGATRWLVAAATAIGALAVSAPSAEHAAAAPNFQMPFPCGQSWSGQTRTNHNPVRSVDLNRADDAGDAVVASAGGTVSGVYNTGSDSYGRYVVVDHGGGWTTLYAHLSSVSVSTGERVPIGQRVGTVGSTGGSTGPHLHFEERLNRSPQPVKFNGSTVYYYGTRTYTSRNGCGGGTPAAYGTVRTAGAALRVRSRPSTSSTVVGSVANGARVSIYCQTTGSTVTGTFGTSNIWNRIGSGRYIADAYTYTGSDGRVAPAC